MNETNKTKIKDFCDNHPKYNNQIKIESFVELEGGQKYSTSVLIQEELEFGSKFRAQTRKSGRTPLSPKTRPAVLPFEACRARQFQKGKRKKEYCEDDSSSPTRSKKLSLLEKSVMSQEEYMTWLATPTVRYREPPPKRKKVKKCEMSPCPPRFVQLAIPHKRKVLCNWNEYEQTLPVEILLRFQEILQTDQNLELRDADDYYKRLERMEKRSARKKKRLKQKKMKEKEKGKFLWVEKNISETVKSIMDFLKEEPLISLTFKQLLISDQILTILDQKRTLEKPSRSTRNHFKQSVIEISDKVAVWMDIITKFVDVQAVESEEDIPPITISSLAQEEAEEEGEEEEEEEEEREEAEAELVGEEEYLFPGYEEEMVNLTEEGYGEGLDTELGKGHNKEEEKGPGIHQESIEEGMAEGETDEEEIFEEGGAENEDKEAEGGGKEEGQDVQIGEERTDKEVDQLGEEFIDEEETRDGEIDEAGRPKTLKKEEKKRPDADIELGGEEEEGEEEPGKKELHKDGKPVDVTNSKGIESDDKEGVIDAELLNDLIKIYEENSPDDYLTNEIGKVPGHTYEEILNKMKQISGEKEGPKKSKLEEAMIEWLKDVAPNEVNERTLKAVHEYACALLEQLRKQGYGEDDIANLGVELLGEDEEGTHLDLIKEEDGSGREGGEGTTTEETEAGASEALGLVEEGYGEEGGITEGEADIIFETDKAVGVGEKKEEDYIYGHKPPTVQEHSPDAICCLSLKIWAVWLLEVTHNAHMWTKWMHEIIRKVREFASIVRGDVKSPDGQRKVLYKSDWKKFVREAEAKIIAWRQYSAHVKELSDGIIENFRNKKVYCCPKCLQDHLIKNVVTAHETLQALTEAMNCAQYWRRCLDGLVQTTSSLTSLEKKISNSEESSEADEIEELNMADYYSDDDDDDDDDDESVYELEEIQGKSASRRSSKD